MNQKEKHVNYYQKIKINNTKNIFFSVIKFN